MSELSSHHKRTPDDWTKSGHLTQGNQLRVSISRNKSFTSWYWDIERSGQLIVLRQLFGKLN